MISFRRVGIVALLAVAIAATGFTANPWATHTSHEHGFSMLLSPQAAISPASVGSWNGLEGVDGALSIHGLVSSGSPVTPDEAMSAAAQITGVPAKLWTRDDGGEEINGWIWYLEATANDTQSVVIGRFGVGPRGNYLFLLVTTPADFEKREAQFRAWAESISLF